MTSMLGRQDDIRVANNGNVVSPFPQEPLWHDTLDVIQKLASSETTEYTAAEIGKVLRFNSEETRQRYGNAIYRRLFGHDRLYGKTLIEAARCYNDVVLVEALWRAIYFFTEPILSRTFLEIIWLREPGSLVAPADIKSYVRTQWKSLTAKVVQRVIVSLTQSGVIRKHAKQFVVSGFASLEAPLLILLHTLFARETPAVTISMATIEGNDFWKFLGYRSLDHVRLALRKAEQQGLLARYAVIDHIEQVTTKYPLSTLIAMAPRV